MKYISKYDEFSLILEGGAAGHIMHPFEDFSMSFGELKSLIDRALSGNLNTEEKPTEKMDGISLSVSYRRGVPIYARGLKELREYGKNALDSKGLIKKFKHAPHVATEIESTVNSLDTIIRKLPIKYVRSIFKNGAVFATIEIISPATTNVIPYNKKLIVVHDFVEYDVTGSSINKSTFETTKFVSKIEKISEALGIPYIFKEPNALDLVKHKNYEKLKSSYLNKIDLIKGSLKDEQTIGDYVEHRFKEYLLKQFNSFNINFDEEIISRLTKRFTYDDKKIVNLIELRKDYPDIYEWAKKFESKNLLSVRKSFILPIEKVVLKLGIEVLKQLSNVMTLSDSASMIKIKDELKNIISKLVSTNNPILFDKAMEQISKLDSLGGLDSVLPTEGLVFRHKGKYYKLTGSFAPINQIMGILRYNR